MMIDTSPKIDTGIDLGKIWVILLAALALRVAWALLIPVIPVSDSSAYDIMARTLAEHGVYGPAPDKPSAFWAVGTAALYATLYAIFTPTYLPVVVVNIILSTAVVGLTIAVGRLFFEDRIALLAGAMIALWPSHILYVTALASELPFMVLFLLGLLAWFNTRLSWTARALLSGLAFGVATYFRSVALLVPMVLWIGAVPDWKRLKREFATMIVAMVVIGATIAPWSVRNTNLFGHFVLLSTNGGVVLWMGNNPETDGFYTPMPAHMQGLNEYELDKAAGEEAKRYILAEPAAFVLRTVKKAILLHAGETIAVHWNEKGIRQRIGEAALYPLKLLTQGSWSAALALALVGIMITVVRQGIVVTAFHPLVLVWAYSTALYAVTVISDRYHFPMHPIVALFASVAILEGLRLVRRRPMGARA